MKFLIALIGLVLVLEGLPWATSPELMQEWLKRMTVMPPHVLRIVGTLTMAVGLLLCYLAQRTTLFG